MNKQETAQIMAVLKAAYPAYYAKISKEEAVVAVNLWADLFADESAVIVASAVKALIASKADSYPPSIGEVKEKIRQLTNAQEMTELEAWALVAEAVRKADWNNPEKQFKKLPEDIQAVLGSPNTIREYGMVTEEQFNTVVASNFQRSYRAKLQARRDYALIPASVKKTVEQIANNAAKRLNGTEEKE